MPPEITREEVLEILRTSAEKDAVIEGLAESVSKQADITMQLVEELKKIKLAVNGGNSNVGIDWNERITINKEFRKTKSPKEMLIEGLQFLSRLEDTVTKYSNAKTLKKELTNLFVWNWKVVAIIGMLLFGGSIGPRVLAFLEEALSYGSP